MNTITRKNIETVGIWTLQRLEFEGGGHEYVIQSSDRKRKVDLFVNERPDFKNERSTYTVEYSHFSKLMDLDETAEFIELAKQALIAGHSFQMAIDKAENNN